MDSRKIVAAHRTPEMATRGQERTEMRQSAEYQCCAGGMTSQQCASAGLVWQRRWWRLRATLLLVLCLVGITNAQSKPEGMMTWGLHFSIAPTFFDPAETTGLATPFLFLYALHDALI